ncbi:MAG: hypothetical protein MRJ68_17645 [Nitrospira sp.]|nr:hypothetical protein [Nitrospira sp.]
MSLEHQDDIFDYPMADTFIAETRPRPYRTGFRSRRHPRRPSLAYINSLNDREFADYIRNGCQVQDSGLAVEVELDELRAQLRELQEEMRALRHTGTVSVPKSLPHGGGLDVSPRA